jgi:hypothetical protein
LNQHTNKQKIVIVVVVVSVATDATAAAVVIKPTACPTQCSYIRIVLIK